MVTLNERFRKLARTVRPTPASTLSPVRTYEDRVDSENRFFGGDRSAHGLPAIYDYWSNKFLRPVLERFGFSTPEQAFLRHLHSAYAASPNATRRFVSVGAGDCSTEVRLAVELVQRKCTDFVIECIELSSEALACAQRSAHERGVSNHLSFRQCDFNQWVPQDQYDGVIANSSLHHVVNLEGLLEGIRDALLPTGTFVTCDTIGRNGHMRWPEALEIVNEYWRELPRRSASRDLKLPKSALCLSNTCLDCPARPTSHRETRSNLLHVVTSCNAVGRRSMYQARLAASATELRRPNSRRG